MNENLVTMTIELDQEVYDQASELFKSLGTTIEDMTVAFLKFCVIPENLPLLKVYLGKKWSYIIGFSRRSSISQPSTRDSL